MTGYSLSGRRLGVYEIAAKVGAGGMGEVYRARDSRLNRDVAIKTLLSAVASDPERLARFSREAQVLASLNHPNIAHIHGLEDGDSGPFLVMEFVEGPTLADRLQAGPLPLDEALAIAKQLADGLEAAHERGIVHRDLKPANVKVTNDGTVKILDFGLAKALDQGLTASPPQGPEQSPTITTPAMTQAGMILGTAAYMSPEQAKGRPVDKRSDVWAFGCVLYEMLAARRAFDGEDVTDTIALVVRGEPDWTALPADTPPQIRLLLKRCLEKDRRARISDIGVARFLMNEPIDSLAAPSPTLAAPPPTVPRLRLFGAAALGVVLGGGVLALAAWALRPPAQVPTVGAFFIATPDDQSLAIQGNDSDIAIAPDGSQIVYRSRIFGSAPEYRLSVRAIADLDVRPLPGTEGARLPFFSPDGRWVGFFVPGEMRKVPVRGGPVVTVCKIEGTSRGASWGDDETIVFAVVGTPLQQVAASGGEPAPLVAGDDAKQTRRFPEVLPGSRRVLYTLGEGSDVQIAALDLQTGQHKTLIPGTAPRYVHPGYLVFASMPAGGNIADRFLTGSLSAVRFDPERLEVLGDPYSVADELLVLITGAAQYAISRNGTFVRVPGNVGRQQQQLQNRSLVWVDRRGREEPLRAPERPYATARISPDGSRVVVDVRDQGGDIWIWDLKRETLTPLNRDPAQDMSPQWMPDGRRIVWSSTRGTGNPSLFAQMADGTGEVERLTTAASNQFPTSIAPDGSHVVLFAGGGATSLDLFTVPLSGSDRKAVPLVHSQARDTGPELSPDGRWLAYHSDESGVSHVYVRPYPNVDAGRWQISTAGGSRAAWRRDGRELFYLDHNGLLTSVSVQTKGDTFVAGAPVKLLSTAYHAGATSLGLDLRGFDVSADGQRFLMIKDLGNASERSKAAVPGLVVVLNWFEELKARLEGR